MRIDPGTATRAETTMDALRRGRMRTARPAVRQHRNPGLTEVHLPYERRRVSPAMAERINAPSETEASPAVSMSGGG